MKVRFPTAEDMACRLLLPMALSAICAVLLSRLLAMPAFALTCAYPERDIERIFMSHQERPETYFLAYGILRPGNPVPLFDEATQSRAPFKARFEGHVAQPRGFDQRARFDLTVKSSCLDDNCGAVPTGPAPALLFIRDEDGSYAFAANPCNDSILFDPTEDELRRALDCLTGECNGQR